MKILHAFAIAAAFGLANIGCAPAQREASSITVPERPTTSDSGGSRAHPPDTTSPAHGSDTSAASLNAKWISALVGMKVETPAGARLGTVKDVIVDGYGRATYAIVAYGGMMGLGNQYTAVPWDSVAEMLQRDRLLMDQAQLENSPLLSGPKPELSNKSWHRDADNYWRGKVALGAGSSTAPAVPVDK